MTTVLHVTDCYAGGIPVAIASYVRNAPVGVEHHLLARVPDGASLAGVRLEDFASVALLGDGPWCAMRTVRQARRRTNADIVHAHSSFAGAYARMAVRDSSRTRIVYTPHCYAFERDDVSRLRRWGYRAAEWLLSFNVGTIAACSEGEAAAAHRRGPRRPRVVHVPNVVVEPPVDRSWSVVASGPLRVVSLGRVAPQKDPAGFAAVVAVLRGHGLEVDPLWMGGGATADVARLEASGVRVSGWIAHPEVAVRLAESDLYLHTAAWEGFPLAVLEAVHAGVPTLVRPIAAFGSLPDALTIDGGLDAMMVSWRSGPAAFATWGSANLRIWAERLRGHTPAGQSSALAEVYGLGRAA